MLSSMQHLAIILMMVLTQTGIGIMQRIINDETLVVPGVGAEKMLLNESTAQFNISYKNQEYRLVKTNDDLDIFLSVYKVSIQPGLMFNEIRYYYNNNAVAFIKNNKIIAVAGLKSDRVTIDAVDLSRGVEFFVYNYGNDSLQMYEEPSGRIYVYKNKGIALFDDHNDDIIDLYMVFIPLNEDH